MTEPTGPGTGPERGLPPELAVLGAGPLEPFDPDVVGIYEINALLGVGGMGRVYLAWAPAVPGAGPVGGRRRGSWVAVKIIRPDLADDEDFRRRFARELDAVGSVDTPYAAALIHGEPEARPPWMVTEFVAGVSLSDAVDPERPLPTPAVWRLAHDLGSALAAVHGAGIVHRDVKPANVILGATGAKVIDFGVAHLSHLTQLTATGLNVGTPAFMAPEQAKTGEVSFASDVFSLGVLLYFALTGKLPFGEGGTAEVLFRVVYEEPDVAALDLVEPDLRELVLRCLSKDKTHRPTAEEIVGLARHGSAMGGWSLEGSVSWPAALAARISERSMAALRTQPGVMPLGVPEADALLTQVVRNPQAPQRRALPPEDVELATEFVRSPTPPPRQRPQPRPVRSGDTAETMFVGEPDGHEELPGFSMPRPDERGSRDLDEPEEFEEERPKRRGALLAVGVAGAIVAVGVGALLLLNSKHNTDNQPGTSTVNNVMPDGSQSASALPTASASKSASLSPTSSSSASATQTWVPTSNPSSNGYTATATGTTSAPTSAPPTTTQPSSAPPTTPSTPPTTQPATTPPATTPPATGTASPQSSK